MAKKKSAAKPAEQEALEKTEPTAEPSISKAEAVRKATAAGMESPGDGVEFIKKNYGIVMEKPAWSSYRAQQKAREAKQSGEPAPAKRGRKPKAAVEGYLAPPSKLRAVGEEGDLIASLETLKPLISSYGAEKVKRLVDLLG